jgi:hypothetical protein
MKRSLIALLAALALAGSASAQSAAAPAAPAVAAAQAQLSTISGKLELINGMIGLKSGGVSYYLPRLRQLVGFVKDLQEGATVKLEGYAYPLPNQAGYSIFEATKLTISGRDYDLGQPGAQGPFGGKGMRGGMGARGGMRGGMGGGMPGGRW